MSGDSSWNFSSAEAGESSVSSGIEDLGVARGKGYSCGTISIEADDPLLEVFSCCIGVEPVDGDAGGIDEMEPDCRGPERDLRGSQHHQHRKYEKHAR